MRVAAVRGGWSTAFAAVLVLSGTCSPQCGKPSGTASTSPTPVAAATPSPTAIPTAPLQASSAPFHGGEVAVAYGAVALSATGGKAPYTWSVFSGALPAGMTIGNDGSVSGTPTAAGNFSFTIQLKDAGDSTASIPATVAIAPALSVGLIGSCARYCNVELGCDSTCGSFGQQSGGAGPYGYSLTGGQLPAGTSLNGLSLNGNFKGLSGWLQFTVQVSDSLGATASVSPKFWMYDHVGLASGSCYGDYFTGCTVSLPISGGVPGAARSARLLAVGQNTTPNPAPYAGSCWTPANTAPPPGYKLSVSGGSVVVSIPSGIGNGYGGIWTVQLDEQTPCAPSTDCASNQATVTIGVQCS